VEGGRIEPVVDAEIPLESAPDALRRMREGDQFGKIVITIGAPGAA
jgi:NADPH:quinone reductase-like Zn-dependent oxidoreductase